jgi:hypothetical protein
MGLGSEWWKSQPDILVNFSAMSGGRFKTGMVIPDSGIYRVLHYAHRLPHEVTLLKGETFPKCQKCSDAVMFQLIRALSYGTIVRELPWRVTLYELPVLDNAASSKTG